MNSNAHLKKSTQTSLAEFPSGRFKKKPMSGKNQSSGIHTCIVHILRMYINNELCIRCDIFVC